MFRSMTRCMKALRHWLDWHARRPRLLAGGDSPPAPELGLAERALAAVNQAREIGIMNTPTIFLGKTRINGWTYYEVMQEIMERQGMHPRQAIAS